MGAAAYIFPRTSDFDRRDRLGVVLFFVIGLSLVLLSDGVPGVGGRGLEFSPVVVAATVMPIVLALLGHPASRA